MVKLIYERAVNYEDLMMIIFSKEEVKLDALVSKGFASSCTPATKEESAAILGEISGLEQLSNYSLCQARSSHHERSILYSLLIFILQNRKTFNLA